MTALHDRIRACLGARDGRWYDGLAVDLAESAWSNLARVGIDRDNYGTARFLRGDPDAPRMGFLMKACGFGRPVPLERYDKMMLARYGVIGLREPRSGFDMPAFERDISRAMRLVDLAPAAGTAVRGLVWSITPVGVEGVDYDTSYSDPAVPFSIFIGAHDPADRVASIRLAEGLLHEAMHLQLSLIERLVPMISGHVEQRHSPWQDRQRPTQGVLHGLYVFRVIQDWLRQVASDPDILVSDADHARRRIKHIELECVGLADLAGSGDLTPEGRILATALTA